jgi:hypothetical protein
MKNLWPWILVGIIICGAISLITYGAINLERPLESNYVQSIKNTYHPVYISTATIIEIDNIMTKLSALNKLGLEENIKTQIAEAPLRAELERQRASEIALENALNIQRVQENRARIGVIENRVKEIDEEITQEIEYKKDEEEVIRKLDVEIAKKVSQGKPLGYNATDSMVYGPMRERVDKANAQISKLKEEKDRKNKELGKLK